MTYTDPGIALPLQVLIEPASIFPTRKLDGRDKGPLWRASEQYRPSHMLYHPNVYVISSVLGCPLRCI